MKTIKRYTLPLILLLDIIAGLPQLGDMHQPVKASHHLFTLEWRRTACGFLRPVAFSHRDTPAIASLISLPETDVETYVSTLPDNEFERIAAEVDARYPYDSVADDTFWNRMSGKERIIVRAVVERQFRQECRRFADGLYATFINDFNGRPVSSRSNYELSVSASYLLSNRSDPDLLGILTSTRPQIYREIEEFEAGFRQRVNMATAVFTGEIKPGIRILGKNLIPNIQALEPGLLPGMLSSISRFLAHINSSTRFYIAATPERKIAFIYGKGHEEEGVFVFDEEWVYSPYLSYDSPAATFGTYPVLKWARQRAMLRARCYLALTGRNDSMLMDPYSPQGREATRILLHKIGINSASELTADSMAPLVEVETRRNIRHELGHVQALADLGYRVGMAGDLAATCEVGNKIGSVLNEDMANFSQAGPYISLARTASQDPAAANLGYLDELAYMLDHIFNQRGDFASNLFVSFKLPIFTMSLRDDGTIDFNRFSQLAAEAYGFMSRELKKLQYSFANEEYSVQAGESDEQALMRVSREKTTEICFRFLKGLFKIRSMTYNQFLRDQATRALAILKATNSPRARPAETPRQSHDLLGNI